MNKTLSKAIMNRTRLRNKFLQSRTDENKKLYTIQRNYCVSLLRKTKREYYSNLDVKNVTDNKAFWKTVKPLLSDKVTSNQKITLIENDEIINNDQETARIFNTFFSNIVSNLNIPEYSNCDRTSDNMNDPVAKAIVKYRNHPSILAIEEVCRGQSGFSFSCVNREEISKEILNLDVSKACQDSDIPSKIIKENADIFTDFLFSSFNNSINNSEFPSVLKLANVIPVFKKGDKNSKENYRPVSILSNISKIFERCIFRQISNFMDTFLSKYQCGFRKGYSTQYCLLAMLEKWKSAVDKQKYFGALLTDLSKAFDCISHELLLAKLHAYGFNIPALTLIQSYLSNRKQRTKVNSLYSSWEEILFGVPQGSILGPLFLNIHICDLFFIISEIDFASYADDNTPYATGDSLNDAIRKLESVSSKLFKWFSDNQMKANKDKCHFITSKQIPATISIDNTNIKNSECEKILGIKVDSNLNFNEHLRGIIKIASRKVNALSRIIPFMNIPKRRILMNSFFTSQFSYCPLVWMFHSRNVNNKINSLHERCLRMVYNDKKSSFEQLLEKDKSVPIHIRNLQFLAIEMYKIHKNLSPPIIKGFFQCKNK